ncbi:DUF397 domain-containing protein [Streptomyces sp. NBC_01481]|uniref:DUF397 domain-containing protein n=1 Tax=Streptomyces sp. NBC_01481 TaxID=2975869 RepID=UPI00225AB9EF|nr:DUF397 domain-containing protein [Streptomyces sp. NBC_01481]MCX4583553.1 DUF397 domain-containing protein [Streptomyces sp. NBC_01481]
MTNKPFAVDGTGLDWFKSSYSDSSNGNDCVEVAATPGTVHIRDSKNAQGPQLAFTEAQWASFVTYTSKP